MKLTTLLPWAAALLACIQASPLNAVRPFARPASFAPIVTLYPITPRDAERNTTIQVPYPPISDDEWDLAVNAGCNLIWAMNSRDELAVTFFPGKVGTIQSPWVNYPQDLQDWGYRPHGETSGDFHAYAGPDVYDAMTALGVNYRMDTEGGPTYAIGWQHTQQTNHDGVDYPPTGALFGTILNVEYGVLIGWHKWGPAHMGARKNPPVTTLPKLKNWSDITFLKWKTIGQRTNKDYTNLRYIISADVSNRHTGAILQKILGHTDVKANCRSYKWANRREFGMDTEAGKALLSSPNGRGAALILIQHKATFGEKTTISKVTFWCGFVANHEMQLMFHVEKQPASPQ